MLFRSERIVQEAGGRVGLVLTGDLHHYARYSSADGPHRITSGGGGAYLSPTHTLPDDVELPPRRGEPGVPYTREAAYPDASTSRKLGWGVLRLAALSPGLGAVIAGVYALLAATMLTALSTADEGTFPERAVSGTGIVLTLLLVAALIVQLDAPAPWRQLVGGLHAAGHVALCAAVVWVVVGAQEPGVVDGAFALVASAAVGFAAGTTLLVAVLLAVSAVFGPRARETGNQVFAAQGLEDHKSFLRMHLDRAGDLHVHALGVDEICRDWTGPFEGRGEARFRPVAGREPRVRRVDVVPPIR